MLFVLIAVQILGVGSYLAAPMDWGFASAAVVGLLVGWVYALIAPLSVMPAERGAFQLLWVEKQAQKLPNRTARFVQREPASTPGGGRHWRTLQANHTEHYQEHRQVQAKMFFLARAFAAATLVVASVLSAACFIQAGATASAFLAWFASALMALGFIPAVVTILASRYRWQRRVPFEILWVHEARTVLARHQTAAENNALERAEVLRDIGDMSYILSRRHCYSPSGSSRRKAQLSWAAHTAPLLDSMAEFEGRGSASSEQVRAWLGSHIDQASKLVMQDHGHIPAASPAHNGYPLYSADRAGLTIVAMLITGLALFVLAALLTSGTTTVAILLDAMRTWPLHISSLLAPIGALVPFLAWLGRSRSR